MTDILTAQHGGETFLDAEPAIKAALQDKSTDVRKEVYKLVAACLKKFSYPDLKSYEVRLVRHLLAGYSEQSADLRQLVSEYLNECGESRKQLEEQMKAQLSS